MATARHARQHLRGALQRHPPAHPIARPLPRRPDAAIVLRRLQHNENQDTATTTSAGRWRIMSPSRPFIMRPVATALLMLAIVLAGMIGFKFLPLSVLPPV